LWLLPWLLDFFYIDCHLPAKAFGGLVVIGLFLYSAGDCLVFSIPMGDHVLVVQANREIENRF
jgi:hypothetical protein